MSRIILRSCSLSVTQHAACRCFEHTQRLCLMKFTHHGLQIEMPDDWWTEAGMPGFVPVFKAYRVNHSLFQNVREAPLEEGGPVIRNSGVGIFNDRQPFPRRYFFRSS